MPLGIDELRELAALVRSTTDLGTLKGYFERRLSTAQLDLERYHSLRSAGDIRRAAASLRRVVKTLVWVVHRLRSLTGRRFIPDETRAALETEAVALRRLLSG